MFSIPVDTLVSNQWLDDIENEVRFRATELDLIRRNEFTDNGVDYVYPWYKASTKNIGNAGIRYLSKFFPNIKSVFLPSFERNWLRIPKNFIYLFTNVEAATVRYIAPFDPDINQKKTTFHKNDIHNLQDHFGRSRYGYYYNSHRGKKKTGPKDTESVIAKMKKLLKEGFSFEKMGVFESLASNSYSIEVFDFIRTEYRRQLEKCYEPLTICKTTFSYAGLLSLTPELEEFLFDSEYFVQIFPNPDVDFSVVSTILSSIRSITMAKVFFKQMKLSLVFEGEENLLLHMVKTNTLPILPQLVDFIKEFFA